MNRGEDCDLLRRLAEHPEFCLSGQELEALLVPENYVGRAPEQVSAFLETHHSLWETDRPCGETPCPSAPSAGWRIIESESRIIRTWFLETQYARR